MPLVKKSKTHRARSKQSEWLALARDKKARAEAGFTGFALSKSDSTLEIKMFDIIDSDDFWGGISPGMVAEALEENPSAESVLCRINSPGGDAFAGIAIRNILKADGRHVTMRIEGLAASAASVIATAGDKVVMGTGSMLMCHKAWTFSAGNADDMRERAETLDKLDLSIASVYSVRNGKTRDENLEMMAATTYFGADEAIENGLADEKMEEIENKEPSARAQLRVAEAFNNLFAAERGSQPKEKKENMTQPADDKLVAALETQISNLTKDAEKIRNENTSLVNELKVKDEKIVAMDKTLAEAKAKLEEERSRADEAHNKATEVEVEALVGVKIYSAEREDFVKLAISNRELFDNMIKNRQDLNLTDRVVGGEKNPQAQRTESNNDVADGNALGEML